MTAHLFTGDLARVPRAMQGCGRISESWEVTGLWQSDPEQVPEDRSMLVPYQAFSESHAWYKHYGHEHLAEINIIHERLSNSCMGRVREPGNIPVLVGPGVTFRVEP